MLTRIAGALHPPLNLLHGELIDDGWALSPTSSRVAGTEMARCPFVNLPNSEGRSRWGAGVTAEDMKALRWVKPAQVVEVAFVEWTRDGLLRRPKFVGMRDDKAARDVRREMTA